MLDRARRPAKALGYLAVGVALRNQAQHVLLALGEAKRVFARRLVSAAARSRQGAGQTELCGTPACHLGGRIRPHWFKHFNGAVQN